MAHRFEIYFYTIPEFLERFHGHRDSVVSTGVVDQYSRAKLR